MIRTGAFDREALLLVTTTGTGFIDGAVMVGPTFANPLRAESIASREEGSTPWLPIVEGGRTVRFTGEQGSLDIPSSPWGPTRIAYLHHGSDPIGFFDPSIAWREPAWLAGDDRAADVSPATDWFPFVTMWQTLLDMPSAGSVPRGYGHLYTVSANLHTWVAIINPDEWTAADTADLADVLESRDEARHALLEHANG